MTEVYVKTLEGETRPLEAENGQILMEVLRDNGLVEGTCGGAASCGTCHIYFANKDIAGTPTEDEGYMLEGLEEFVEIRDCSRLACQIQVSDALDGIEIEIAPQI